MRNKYITFICLIFILCLCCSCNNKENIRINTVDKKKQDVISEDITIDKAYLNKRYPNKTVLTWVYHEKEYMSDKERELYKRVSMSLDDFEDAMQKAGYKIPELV